MSSTHVLAGFSDIHLGHVPEKNPHQTARDQADAVCRGIDRAAGHGATELLIAGDLFDRCTAGYPEKQAAAVVAAADCIIDRALRQAMGVIVVSGNHDAASGLLGHLRPRAGLTVVTDGAPVVIGIDGTTTDIVTAGVVDDPDPRRIIRDFPAPGNGRTTIGMLHTSVTGELSKSVCLPTTRRELVDLGYDAWLLGHVHQPTVVNDNPPIVWPGCHWGKYPTDCEPGWVEITVDGGKTTAVFRSL